MIEILIWAAIIPSIILIILVLKQDKIESEPIGLLIKLFFFGALTTLPAGLLETWGEMGIMAITRDKDMQTLLMFLICVPLAEEGLKYIALATTWKHEAFNFTFDGIVYAVIVSLGFATLENILYVMNYMSLQVALVRGILSVPLHCTCGVFMGYFYGMARNHNAHGEHSRSVLERLLALIVPLFIHGLYDFALSVDSNAISLAGLGFTVIIFILSFMQVRWSSKQDAYIIGTDVPIQQPVQQVPVNPQYPQQYAQPQYAQLQYQQPNQQPMQPQYPQQYQQPSYQQPQYQQPVQPQYQQPQYPQQYAQPQYPQQYQQPAQQQYQVPKPVDSQQPPRP